jgi:hypothetical protein
MKSTREENLSVDTSQLFNLDPGVNLTTFTIITPHNFTPSANDRFGIPPPMGHNLHSRLHATVFSFDSNLVIPICNSVSLLSRRGGPRSLVQTPLIFASPQPAPLLLEAAA